MGLYASVNTLMRWLTAISTEPCLKAWTEALLLPGEKTLEESLLAELAQFFHLTKGQVRARCLSATADLAREWQQRNPQTAQDMVDFYLNIAPRIYPFELMWYHAIHDERTPLDALIAMVYALQLGYRKCLDFGCGIGSHGIVFKKNGFDVTLNDISRELLTFAEWRFHIRGLEATFVDSDTKLTRDHFEIIIAFDVLEHLADPIGVLRLLTDSLVSGGILCITMPEVYEPDYPLHVSYYSDHVRREMQKLRLLRIDKVWNGVIYRKVDYPVLNEERWSVVTPIVKKIRYAIRRRKLQVPFQRLIQTCHWQEANGGVGCVTWADQCQR